MQSTTARPNVYALLGAALAAATDAQRIGFRIRVDEHGIDAWPGTDDLTANVMNARQATKEDAERVAGAWHVAASALDEALIVLAADARQLAELRSSIPTSYAEALIAWHFQQREHEDALHNLATARVGFASLEDAMGRVRRECGRKIQAEHAASGKPGSDKPIADTPLDKLAGDHPEYVAHRNSMAEAKERVEHWGARVTSLAGRVDIARVVAEGLMRSEVSTAARGVVSLLNQHHERARPADGALIHRTD